MTFDARVVEILIASPGDVETERLTAVDVIQEWNRSNSSQEHAVLLPRRWESHSAPELGDRPQAVINRQVVDQSDLVVAVFWTRLGTPTGTSASGTVEEIERAREQGKLVMVYFSQNTINPYSLDLDELTRLRHFREALQPFGLVETYTDLVDFRDKLRRQLDQQVRRLLVEDAQRQTNTGVAVDLNIQLERESDTTEGSGMVSFAVTCSDIDEIPDFVPNKPAVSTAASVLYTVPNRDYYRQFVEWYVESVSAVPVHLLLANEGAVAIRDIRLEFRTVDVTTVKFLAYRPQKPTQDSSYTGYTTSYTGYPFFAAGQESSGDARLTVITDPTVPIKLVAEWLVLQSGRQVASRQFYITATESTKLSLDGTVYSSASSKFSRTITADVEVRNVTMTWREIFENAGEALPPQAATS